MKSHAIREFSFLRASRISFALITSLFLTNLAFVQTRVVAQESVSVVNLEGYDPTCAIEVTHESTIVNVVWPADDDRRIRMTFDLEQEQPMIRSVAIARGNGQPFRSVAKGLDPLVMLRVGNRDLDLRGGWTVFFDRMQTKPHELFSAQIHKTTADVTGHSQRATITIGPVSAGPFHGHMRWTFFAGCSFVLQEAVLKTELTSAAYIYDAGILCRRELPQTMTWHDAKGSLEKAAANPTESARHLAVKGRAISASFRHGSLAVFPPPHRYFYPLDFSRNLKNIWMGTALNEQPSNPFGLGIRHSAQGDNRFVPWFNAPPGTAQQMGVFLLISDQPGDKTLEAVARLTRNDRFAPLAGHVVFSSHFHVEHTREILKPQPRDDGPTGQSSSGRTYHIPTRLIEPGFVKVFRDQGIDIVHLAEFHFRHTPGLATRQRLQQLDVLHAECRRLSDDRLLLLPGEEPNVHFGGHWISFFPRPVNWILNRPEGIPFVHDDPQFGRVYHVGSEADMLRLLKAENGLAWTAHPRIKGSTGFPDRYSDSLFFQSDRFLGAAWKAMPADLSQPRLGSRVLNLLDDMSNWGSPKYVIGEVDVFKIEPDHELFGHMNVNYLQMDSIPRFDDGWQPVLDALSNGRFFVTTGEVLIPQFSVGGAPSGEVAKLNPDGKTKVRVQLDWTFPLSYLEIVSGDGRKTNRQSFDLSATGSYGNEVMTFEVVLKGDRWVRLEVWDVATNGAFTQPVRLATQ